MMPNSQEIEHIGYNCGSEEQKKIEEAGTNPETTGPVENLCEKLQKRLTKGKSQKKPHKSFFNFFSSRLQSNNQNKSNIDFYPIYPCTIFS
jgi:hypothetical protein